MTIYALPGLGADERVFKYLSLKVKPLQWITPGNRESLASYVQRLIAQIDTSKAFALIGVSFGGMVAVEMSKYIAPQKIIIISSAATKDELPCTIGFVRKSEMVKVIPGFMLKPPSFPASWLFGVKSENNKRLLREIIKDTDVKFLKWAIHKIVYWENKYIPDNLVRIHGDNDRLLKMNKGLIYEVVKEGGHFMIVEQAEEINQLIERHLG